MEGKLVRPAASERFVKRDAFKQHLSPCGDTLVISVQQTALRVEHREKVIRSSAL